MDSSPFMQLNLPPMRNMLPSMPLRSMSSMPSSMGSICFVETCPNPLQCPAHHISLRSPLSLPFPFPTYPSPYLRLPFPSHPNGPFLPPLPSNYSSQLQPQIPQTSTSITSTSQPISTNDVRLNESTTFIGSNDVHQSSPPSSIMPLHYTIKHEVTNLDHSASSSSTSRDLSESPKSGGSLRGHSILASILRGEDFCGDGSGTSSSGGLSPHSDQLDVERTSPPQQPEHQRLTPAYSISLPPPPFVHVNNSIPDVKHQALLQPVNNVLPQSHIQQASPYQPLSTFPVSNPGLTVSTGGCMNGVGRLSSPSSQSSISSDSPCSHFAPLPLNSQAPCAICEDKASGFHYGVVSCEGCKGFFRRTVQRNMSYRCHKSGNCTVSRTTRNRCQSCRFHKCVRRGMRVESVRPERSRKKKLKEEQEEAALKETGKIQETIDLLLKAHTTTAMPQSVVRCTQEALNVHGTPEGHRQIHSFCQLVPGFSDLDVRDQALLFQHSALEIMMLRTAQACSEARLNDSQIKGELGMSVIKLRDTFGQLDVCPEEVSLLAAICLICPTRPGLHNVDEVEKKQEPLLEALRVQVQLRRSSFHNAFAKLLMRVSDLRTAALKCNQQIQSEMNAMYQDRKPEVQMLAT